MHFQNQKSLVVFMYDAGSPKIKVYLEQKYEKHDYSLTTQYSPDFEK